MPAVLLVLAAVALGGRAAPVGAAPAETLVVGVVAAPADLDEVVRGVRAALADDGGESPGARIEAISDEGEEAGLEQAVRRLRQAGAGVVLAAPSTEVLPATWKAAKGLRAPWVLLRSLAPSLERDPGWVHHLAPSPAEQGLRAADRLLAPLAARRVAVVHEPTAFGRELAAALVRNLSARIALAGIREWPDGAGAAEVAALEGLEADWLYVALVGRRAEAFVRALESLGRERRCLFADGNRSDGLVALAPLALEGSAFVDGPDPELEGRVGEAAVLRIERDGGTASSLAVRAYEGARRALSAARRAGSVKGRRLVEVFGEDAPGAGTLGALSFAPWRGVRHFPLRLWRVRQGRLETWPDGLFPTPGCGPPLGFGRPPPARLGERGRLGYLTYGEGDKRTIERDLLEIGLSTDGKDPDLDAFLRDEILGRAIRIAHRLFRREADGTPIPAWSWGMTFTTAPPGEDVPRSRTWLAIVAGDHPAAGGQVIGSGMVAVYSTFLKRTMYAARKLEPPVSAADRPLLDGTYRWGEDRVLNRRADEIRCLLDGFASAVGLTLAHEFGHLCGCGHDTEHPTSIMNVVAGAGASWEDAVWIPAHVKSVTTTLGLDEEER